MLEAGLVALQQILAGDPECADALFYRGQILERLGQTASASRDFRKIARLDERHVGGQREVGLHAMPVRDAASGSMRQRPMSSAELHGTGTTGPVASGLRRLLRSVAGK